jgi:hypothetical protein
MSIVLRRDPKTVIPDFIDWFEEPFLTLWERLQVGVLALESAAESKLSRPYPFDVLCGQTQAQHEG